MKFKASLLIALSLALKTQTVLAAAPQEVAVNLLSSGHIDLIQDTITVPLHHGHLKDSTEVWYVLLDASDSAKAGSLGLVYAPALAYAAQAVGTRTATIDSHGEWVFNQGKVDFSPPRSVTPGDAPNLFPPKAATPGSVGSPEYSPYVVVDGVVYNAPIIANDVGIGEISLCDQVIPHEIVHDKVTRLCPEEGKVTLALSHGFASGKPLIYVSLDANDPLAAAMEGATYAPALNALKTTSATLPLFAVTNGQTGKNNPNRQGFDSALLGDGSPLNVLTGIPTLSTVPYSPLWDLHVASWTDSAVAAGQQKVLTSSGDFSTAFRSGLIKGLGGDGLPSSGLLVNCPAVAILN